jgi:hypothetical protein
MSHILVNGDNAFLTAGNLTGFRDNYHYISSIVASYGAITPQVIEFDNISSGVFYAIDGPNRNIDIYSASTFVKLSSVNFPGSISYLHLDNDPVDANDRMILTGTGSNPFKIIRKSDMALLFAGNPITSPNTLFGAVFDPEPANKRVIATNGVDTFFEFIESATGANDYQLVRYVSGFSSISGICFDPVTENKRLFINDSGTFYVYNTDTLLLKRTVTFPTTLYCEVKFDPNPINNRLVVGQQSMIYSIDATTYGIKEKIPMLTGTSTSLAFDPIAENRRMIYQGNIAANGVIVEVHQVGQ